MPLRLLVALAVLALAVACSKKTPPTAAKTPPAPPAAPAEKKSPEPAAEAPPAKPPAEPAKANAAPSLKPSPAMPAGVTPADRLGTLPDGMGLTRGSAVPDFSATTVEGQAFTRADLMDGGAKLVVFYRGGWCPYCNHQVRQMTEKFEELKALGVTPVMVSVDKADATSVMQRTYDVPFPLVSDPELSMHEAFKIAQEVPPEMVDKLMGFGFDIEQWSGQTHHKMAMPSCFLVDTGGVVQWCHADGDYKVRPSPQQMMEAIKTWKSSEGG
jgi:peroxiredoxin